MTILKRTVGRISERTPQALAVMAAKEMERLVKQYLLKPQFRKAVIKRKIASLSDMESLAARYLLFAIGGGIHALSDMNEPFQIFAGEVLAGVLAEIGMHISDPERKELTRETLPIIHDEFVSRINQDKNGRSLAAQIFGSWEDLGDSIDTADTKITQIRERRRKERRPA